MKKNDWYAAKRQSLASYARDAGFDLAVYHDYPEAVQEILRKRAIREALWAIEEECAEQDFDVKEVDRGVYVIALSDPLSIQYRYKRSQVIYIGMGNIMPRIKAHFEWSLFDFMLDLSGAEFDFHFACPALKGTAMYYKHVEHLMLQYFNEKYGGLDDKGRFPILNKNAGSNKEFVGGTGWWKSPLKSTGRKPLWALKPTDFNIYAPLDQGG